jgi:hypothetical protein
MRIALIGVVLIALSGCAQQQKLTQHTCIIGHASGFAGTNGNREQITVAENGDPCVMDMSMGRNEGGLRGAIVTPPTHGTASVQTTPYGAQLVYAPARHYTGDDMFEAAFGPDFNVTVLVRVVSLEGR